MPSRLLAPTWAHRRISEYCRHLAVIDIDAKSSMRRSLWLSRGHLSWPHSLIICTASTRYLARSGWVGLGGWLILARHTSRFAQIWQAPRSVSGTYCLRLIGSRLFETPVYVLSRHAYWAYVRNRESPVAEVSLLNGTLLKCVRNAFSNVYLGAFGDM